MSYKSDWRATPRCGHAIVLSDGTTLLRMRRRYLRAERWGLFAFADPLRPACKTSVFWLPHMSRRTIRARCNLNISNRPAGVIRLASFRTKRVAVAGVDGVSVITMKSGDSRTSLVAHGWPVLTRPARITFELDGFDELNARIDCLRMLQKLADPASTIPYSPLPSALDNRLRQALLALDGSHRRRKLSSDCDNDFWGRTRPPRLGCGQSFPQRPNPPAGRQRPGAHEWRLSRLAALIVVSPWVSISRLAVFDTPALPLARSSCPTLALAGHCVSGRGR
jgi:hypothetical protein